MQVRIVVVTPFQQNCRVFWCEETMKGAVVDPGGDLDHIEAAIKESGASIEKILLTHGHVDHAAAAGTLAERLGVPIEGPHIGDKFLIDGLPDQAAKYGFGDAEPFQPTLWLDQGDTVMVGNLKLDVKHCPGHSPGHVIFNIEAFKVAIVGDVLFQGSIGRTDLPGGDHEALINSIRTQLWPLGDDITFVPGHGPASTFAVERKSNPFVADKLFR
jgi:hydroxyacylglutathione hydrolase